MEERCSVNSPRRILSFSKNKRASVTFPNTDNRSLPEFRVSGHHGPKLSEVYGFVGSITTVVATVVFIIWAYVPDHWLHSIGIYYYPSRYWALAVPTYLMVTIVLAILFYIGMNFLATPPPTSLNSMFGKFIYRNCLDLSDPYHFGIVTKTTLEVWSNSKNPANFEN
ncbi:phosphatidylinositol n-acetylglucosaminyltransferase subunit p [Phtheirospermum japonicum]|uniref:Phosphatidylinositol n-acetylglucosaminyltransferase subunit p n=1 Tax=Phtheirospermum japonicum TaxID=374723 RepID=A0A830BHD5_9LAMI|nr:phosphatidylinositol n-acetylglucosaminyltransferase subunit p [Phtheirospermum japonicum]